MKAPLLLPGLSAIFLLSSHSATGQHGYCLVLSNPPLVHLAFTELLWYARLCASFQEHRGMWLLSWSLQSGWRVLGSWQDKLYQKVESQITGKFKSHGSTSVYTGWWIWDNPEDLSFDWSCHFLQNWWYRMSELPINHMRKPHLDTLLTHRMLFPLQLLCCFAFKNHPFFSYNTEREKPLDIKKAVIALIFRHILFWRVEMWEGEKKKYNWGVLLCIGNKLFEASSQYSLWHLNSDITS